VIVHELPDGRLWCINQTSHAQQAAELCRHWGNADVAPLAPGASGPVLLGVAQHDNGWWEWERAAEIRPDGYPMDFVHGPAWSHKLELWRVGVARAFDQHPYAGVLVGYHAALLYDRYLDSMGDEERRGTKGFIAEQADVRREARRLLAEATSLRAALTDEAVEAHTRLLQFGDTSSLLLCMPWAGRTLERCPVDWSGGYVAIRAEPSGRRLSYEPWPFGVDRFEVDIWGRVLERRHFDDNAAYRAALAGASASHRRWTVERT
jgi:hypothetical protein